MRPVIGGELEGPGLVGALITGVVVSAQGRIDGDVAGWFGVQD